jgi:pimeloyl-ACP methyl ester carboxylesterase
MVRVAVVNELHMDVLGDGVPAFFVHGSFGWGLETFPDQRALADQYQVVLIDRCGFGGSASQEAEGWPVDMHDVAALLDDVGPAHMVGQSYGAVVVLLAAGLRPKRVRSLVAIEPPAFEVARGDADADATTTSLKPVFDRAHTLTAEEFVTDWARANGMPEERLATWIEGFGDQEWAAAEASRRERWPGDAPIQFDVLAAAAFPKVLVRGGWKAEVVGRDGAGRNYAAVCRAICDRIGGRLVVFERSSHNPQLQEPQAFNQLLREVWRQ